MRFSALGADDPQREAALLLTSVCPFRLAELVAAPDAPLGKAAAPLAAAAARRFAGEPLSRILGRREFWSLEFAISPDVLDPRPDTETIVEAALAAFAARRAEPLRVLDLGVGSGALLCALLSEFSAARGLGVDLSEAAAAVARANVEALGFGDRAEVRVGDWATGLDGPFDLARGQSALRAQRRYRVSWSARRAFTIRVSRSTAARTGSTPTARWRRDWPGCSRRRAGSLSKSAPARPKP